MVPRRTRARGRHRRRRIRKRCCSRRRRHDAGRPRCTWCKSGCRRRSDQSWLSLLSFELLLWPQDGPQKVDDLDRLPQVGLDAMSRRIEESIAANVGLGPSNEAPEHVKRLAPRLPRLEVLGDEGATAIEQVPEARGRVEVATEEEAVHPR